jgi:excisionase family DNA binding protein
MSEPKKNPFDLLLDQIRAVVREEIAAALSSNGHVEEKETLLMPEEAAKLIGVKKEWLYRHAKHLPFCRKLSRKAIRFNEAGLKRWLAARK